MSVPHSGLEAQIVDLVATMLATSISFQGLVGASDVAGARAHIVEIDDTPPTGAHAAVNRPDVDMSSVSSDHVLGTASCDVVVIFPPTAGLTATESFRDACNKGSAILRQLCEYDCPLIQGIIPSPPVMLDDSDELSGWFMKTYTITMLCMP